MDKYVIEMSYICNVNVEIEGETLKDAINKAKELVNKEVTILGTNQVDISELMFDDVTYFEML